MDKNVHKGYLLQIKISNGRMSLINTRRVLIFVFLRDVIEIYPNFTLIR